MRLQRRGPRGRETPVVETGLGAYDLSGVISDIGPEFFEQGGLDIVRRALESGRLTRFDTDGVRVGSPVARPGKVVCIGLNYHDHAAETGAQVPAEPVVFMKDASTVIGPHDEVHIPKGSVKTDWEVELGVIIGARARYLSSPAAARDVIAGYVVSHDVSEREFQLERGGQWDKGKSCETFNPLGPTFVTADEVDASSLGLRLWVNGTLMQDGNTADLVFSVEHVVWYLSQFMVLEPGDLVNTGTPAGVALGRVDHPYLRAGDVVEVEIEGLGRQRSSVIDAPADDADRSTGSPS